MCPLKLHPLCVPTLVIHNFCISIWRNKASWMFIWNSHSWETKDTCIRCALNQVSIYTVGRFTFEDTKFRGFCGFLQNLKTIYPQNCKIVYFYCLLLACPRKFIHKIFCLKQIFDNSQIYIFQNKSPYGISAISITLHHWC